MKTIAVMMSTYNGEKYICEQIDSILQQKGVKVILVIRDDGSVDSTVTIIKNYLPNENILFYQEKNIGASKSFVELLFLAPEADYYAFSDQDDVWNKDKLLIAVKAIEKKESMPALYHGLAGKVDKDLKSLENKPYMPVQTFPGALLTSATGCTMVFNNSLMSLLRKQKPNNISMHDAWVYRVCYAFDGYVFYDTQSHLKYRQHDNNVSGGQMSLKEKINRQLVKNKGVRLGTGIELYYCFGNEIPSNNQKILKRFISYRTSIKDKLLIVFGKEFKANRVKTTIQFKILFLLNYI